MILAWYKNIYRTTRPISPLLIYLFSLLSTSILNIILHNTAPLLPFHVTFAPHSIPISFTPLQRRTFTSSLLSFLFLPFLLSTSLLKNSLLISLLHLFLPELLFLSSPLYTCSFHNFIPFSSLLFLRLISLCKCSLHNFSSFLLQCSFPCFSLLYTCSFPNFI